MSSLTEINSKNHGPYYPDDIKNIKDLDSEKSLVYGRPYQNNFIYHVTYKPHTVENLYVLVLMK